MKKLLLLLIITLLPCFSAGAEDYDSYAFTPEQGVEMVSYVALSEDNYVYNNLRDLTLMGIFRQERGFSLANYVTLPDCLKLLFRCAGLEDYAYACGEDFELRAELGIDPSLPCKPTDGFFIAAYQKGLITRERLEGYFANAPGCGPEHYAVRGEVVVWITKLFGISPSYDYTVLNRYGDTSLIAPAYMPYFAGAVNSGAGIAVNGSYNPCSLIKNGDLVTLITRFYPYLLETNGIKSVTARVTGVTANENGELTVTTSENITLNATPENSCLLVGSSFVDNLYMLLSVPNITSRKITVHIKGDKVLFVSTTVNQPAAEHSAEFKAQLYFYDNSTRAAVFTTDDGYLQYFLAENAKISDGEKTLSTEELMNYTDKTFKITLRSVNQNSFKKIVMLETGGES